MKIMRSSTLGVIRHLINDIVDKKGGRMIVFKKIVYFDPTKNQKEEIYVRIFSICTLHTKI